MERIRYHVPEDGDDAAHPNVFELVSEGAVRVGDVRRHFPLPGRFHLRFRRRVAGREVWADAADDAAPAPRLAGRILVKASRLAGDAARARARPPPSPRRASAPPPARPPPPPPPPPRETNLLGLGEASPPAPRAEPNLLGSPPISRSEPNLLGLDAPAAADSLNMFAGLDATAPAPAPAPMQSNNAPDPFAAPPPPRRSSAPPPKGTFDAFSDFKL